MLALMPYNAYHANMEVNRFERALFERQASQQAEARRQDDIERYYLQVSADSSGTALEEHLSPEDVQLCRDFLDHVRKTGVKGAPLMLEKKSGVLTKLERELGSSAVDKQTIPVTRMNFSTQSIGFTRTVQEPLSKKGKEFARKKWQRIWVGEGFEIGKANGDHPLHGSQSEKVYLCTDGKLRCTRSGLLFNDRSVAAGVGTVPNDAVVIAVHTTSTFDYDGTSRGSNHYYELQGILENSLINNGELSS